MEVDYLCSEENLINQLKEKKKKELELKKQFAKKFEDLGKDLRLLAFLNSSIKEIIARKKKILALIENQKTENPIDKSFDEYQSYNLAVEHLWKYFDAKVTDPSTVKDIIQLQEGVNNNLGDLIKKMDKCMYIKVWWT